MGGLQVRGPFLGFLGSFPKVGYPNIDPQKIIILVMGTPNKVPLILGNPHVLRSSLGPRNDGKPYVLG